MQFSLAKTWSEQRPLQKWHSNCRHGWPTQDASFMVMSQTSLGSCAVPVCHVRKARQGGHTCAAASLRPAAQAAWGRPGRVARGSCCCGERALPSHVHCCSPEHLTEPCSAVVPGSAPNRRSQYSHIWQQGKFSILSQAASVYLLLDFCTFQLLIPFKTFTVCFADLHSPKSWR